MTGDKYTAIWVSHTSIKDFLKCPRSYYLKNIYRDPKTGHKIKLTNPPLALGQAVHEVIESISTLPVEKRFEIPLIAKFVNIWEKVSGKKGGFPNPDVENKYKKRGQEMIKRIVNNPGPLVRLAVKIKMDLPHYWLSEEDNIILCGKIDWLEYLPDTDSVHIIDFKTTRKTEGADSLQLPIYHLLAYQCQERPVTKASYWYLERNDTPTEVPLSDIEEAHAKVLETAKQIKLARQLDRYKCSQKKGCPACRPYESIVWGNAEFVGVDEFDRDIYILDRPLSENETSSIIL